MYYSNLSIKEFFSVVIGAGGAGMRVALDISKTGFSCALIPKCFLLVHTQYLLKEGLQ